MSRDPSNDRPATRSAAGDVPDHPLPAIPLEYQQGAARPQAEVGRDEQERVQDVGEDPRTPMAGNMGDNTDAFRFSLRCMPEFKWEESPDGARRFFRKWRMYLASSGLKLIRTDGYLKADGTADPDKNGDNGTAAERKKELIWTALLHTLDAAWFEYAERYESDFDVEGLLADMRRKADAPGLQLKHTDAFHAMSQGASECLQAYFQRLRAAASLCGFDSRLATWTSTKVAASDMQAVRREASEVVVETMVLRRMAKSAVGQPVRLRLLEGLEEDETAADLVEAARALQNRSRDLARPGGSVAATTPASANSQEQHCMQCGGTFRGTWRNDHLLPGHCTATFICKNCHRPGHHHFQCTEPNTMAPTRGEVAAAVASSNKAPVARAAPRCGRPARPRRPLLSQPKPP